jgi:hyperosmotically inducible protein
MNMFKNSFLLCVIIFFIAGVSAESVFSQNGGGAFEKSRIDRQIRKEIMTLTYYGVFDAIGYSLTGDTVTLNGYVTHPTTKKDAEESVSDVAGVGRVVNNIEVLPNSPSDDRLRQRILQTFVRRGGGLYRYFMGTNPPVRIIVNRGRVSLEGYADTRGDSNTMYILARGVPGSFAVKNNLKVLKDMPQ